MKNIILLLASCFSLSLAAQTTATWQGGKPGRPTDWHCAANWKEGRTPDEFSAVHIPGGQSWYPVVSLAAGPVDALFLESEATLTIGKNGSLAILAETGRRGGLLLSGNIQNEGRLQVNIRLESLQLQRIQGDGSVIDLSDSTALSRH